jgi:hypothetical protein
LAINAACRKGREAKRCRISTPEFLPGTKPGTFQEAELSLTTSKGSVTSGLAKATAILWIIFLFIILSTPGRTVRLDEPPPTAKLAAAVLSHQRPKGVTEDAKEVEP